MSVRLRIKPNLKRVVVDGFTFPLGWKPPKPSRPMEGYTITYQQGEGDLPDAFQFLIVVSHEKLKSLVDRLFGLMPDEVVPILEAGSRDAYRQVDVLMSDEGLPFAAFYAVWRYFETVLLEDGAIAAGAMSEDPYIEVFLDEYKGVSLSVAADRREQIESILHEMNLHEVPEHWTDDSIDEGLRTVIDEAPGWMSLDDVILNLQRAWTLELNVDLTTNVDDAGRELGVTLWHIVTLAQSTTPDDETRAYVEIWLAADSLGRVEEMVAEVFDELEEWEFEMMIAQDRVAYDDRPEELGELEPGAREIDVYSVTVFPAPG